MCAGRCRGALDLTVVKVRLLCGYEKCPWKLDVDPPVAFDVDVDCLKSWQDVRMGMED